MLHLGPLIVVFKMLHVYRSLKIKTQPEVNLVKLDQIPTRRQFFFNPIRPESLALTAFRWFSANDLATVHCFSTWASTSKNVKHNHKHYFSPQMSRIFICILILRSKSPNSFSGMAWVFGPWEVSAAATWTSILEGLVIYTNVY